MSSDQTRAYDRNESVVFLKTKEAFGGLSNMAGGFPLRVNGIRILTSEALYQVCRFPHMPEVQRIIIGEASPMTAKMKSKPYRGNSRQDWDRVRVKVMRWCLRVKLAQNWLAFSKLLLETEERPIVEESRKDAFWGAKPMDGNTLVGINVLGRLLMELREEIKVGDREAFRCVESLVIPDFLLDGRPIDAVRAGGTGAAPNASRYEERKSAGPAEPVQPSFFDQPAVREAPAPYAPAVRNRDWGVAGLKPYPEMKDSGAPWLGAVPAHWEVRSLGSLATSISLRGRPDLPLLSVVREKGVIARALTGDDANHNFIPDDLSNYKVVRAGNLVINKMKAWQGSLGIAPMDGIVSPAYFVFDLAVDDRRFGQALLRSKTYVSFFARASDGVRIGQWDLSIDGMKRIPVVLPPQDEQAAIVRFLDHADRRIRRAIRAKQQLIALLGEQKQAIIHRAVTRGLDPDVCLKPSGVEWLGDVPAHWDVLAVKRVLLRLIDCEHKTAPAVDDSNFRVVRTSGVRNGTLRIAGTYCTTEQAFHDWTRRELPEPGDVVFTREAPVGEACVIPDGMQVCLGQRTVLMKVDRERYESQFLVHMIYAGPPAGRIKVASQGSTVGHFNMDDIASMTIFAPPLEEQRALLRHIAEQVGPLEAVEARARGEIELLREYRTRLIADVVTGKLDVREAAWRLPDEVEPADAVLDDTLAEGDEDAAEAADESDTEAVVA